MTINEVPILNDFDCPLLILTDNVVCVPSSDVISPTSILHECSSNCQSTTLQREITIERESVLSDTSELNFTHDFSCIIYFLNVFVIPCHKMNL